MDWDQPRPPVSLLLMVQIARDHGASAEACLNGTGLSAESLLDPRTEVTPRDDLAVARNLVELVRFGHPGLMMGSRFRLAEQGIYGFALLSSPTLRAAVDVGLRFLDLAFAMGTVTASDDDAGDLILRLDAPHLPLTVRRFYVERDAASIATIAQVIAPGLPAITRVEFAFSPPPDGDAQYVAALGVAPVFNAAETAVVLDRSVLDSPLPGANPHTAAQAINQCRLLLDSRRARTGVAGRVRDELLAGISAPPSLDAVAASLHMSGRTLRKRLAEEGTSYRLLLDEVREHLAEELLLTGRIPVEHIAHRLGYVEVSSFSQAFRRWKGVGPREFRSTFQAGKRGA